MMDSFAGKKVLVHGLGLHGGGISVVRWLLKNKAIVTVTDLKTASQLKKSLQKIKKFPGSNKIRYTLGRHVLADFRNQDLIVQNPGVPRESKFLKFAKEKNIPIVNEAVMFFGLFDGPIVAVTGTRGKSTTSVILHKILRTKIKNHVLAGNIAKTPMLDVVDKLKKDALPVLELSSWHLENLDAYRRSPHVAVITNVLPDHLNRYKSFSEYREAKYAITAHQTKNDFVILNADNQHTLSFAKKTEARVFYFSTRKKVRGCYLKHNSIFFFDGKKEKRVLGIEKIKIPGKHNLANILGAVTAAKVIGVPKSGIISAVANFKGVFYRLEKKATIHGIEIYNDSTSTNPDATGAAIDALRDRPMVLIAGGMNKGLAYDKLAAKIISSKIKVILIPGTASDLLELALKRGKCQLFHKCKTLGQSFELAWKLVQKNGRIVFSPGAASFNMFENEFDRARQFDKLINDKKKKLK